MTTNTARNDHATFCGCSDCEIVYNSKPFKSARAAKMAYTKARHAYDAARAAANNQRHEFGKDGWNEERFAIVRGLEVAYAEKFEAMRAVYVVASAQGFYVNSWHFGCNPTRDIIAANMD